MTTLQSESSGDGNSEWFMSIVGCKLTTFSGNRGKFGKKIWQNWKSKQMMNKRTGMPVLVIFGGILVLFVLVLNIAC